MNLELQGKVAIVLAASKGPGRASAEALAADGAWVAIGSPNGEQLEQTAREIRDKTGSKVLPVPAQRDKTGQSRGHS